MDLRELMFSLIRSQIDGKAVSEEIKLSAKENLKELYMLSAPQGLASILGQALSDQKILEDDPVSRQIRSKTMHTFQVQMKQEIAFSQITNCLENHQIQFVPLKGAEIRKYYPQSWMRTSCDIDILVQEKDLKQAINALKEDLNYTQPADREYHDVVLYSPQGVVLELHFSLKENDERLDKVLSKVWEYVVSDGTHTYQRTMEQTFFVYHIVAHCAYHFMSSGCGAKPLLDLWLLRHRMGYEEEKVMELCQESGIGQFYLQIMSLAEVWFAGAEMTPFLDCLASYILEAGFGGSVENATAAAVLKKGSKSKFLLDRVFLPYDMLKEYYPVLNGRRWLLPIYQICRWIAGVKRRRLGTTLHAMKTGKAVSDETLKTTEELFNKLGLL